MTLVIERGGETERVHTTDDLLVWWVARATERHAPDPRYPSEHIHSVHAEGDRLYHYGHHFELARILRTPKGTPRLFLLNGDNYSSGSRWGGPSTANRQSRVRSLVQATDIPWLVIPFSAMESGGIKFDTVQVVDSSPERWTTHEHESNERPGNFTVRDYDTGELSDDTAEVDHVPAHHIRDTPARLGTDNVWRWTTRRHHLGDALIRAKLTEQKERPATKREREAYEAQERWTIEWNRLRDEQRQRQDTVAHLAWRLRDGERELADELESARTALTSAQKDVADHELKAPHVDIDIRRTPSRASAEGRIVVRYTERRWSYFLSSFDYNEPWPLYFLCEIPRMSERYGQKYRPKPQTIAQALDDLRPGAVVEAEDAGIEVLRQGDVFAIRTELTTRELTNLAVPGERTRYVESGDGISHRMLPERYEVLRRPSEHVLDTSHKVTEVIITKDGETYARGIMRHEPRETWRSGRPDHKRVVLGDRRTWYRLVKNTVESNRAWSISGGVD